MKTLLLLPIVCFLTVHALFAETERMHNAPNIVIIFGDDMPPTHVGAYHGNYKTPAIDRLAKDGIRFNESFCVSSMCTPSRYSLLTGKYPGRCRSQKFMEDNPIDDVYTIAWNTELADDEVCIADAFSKLGYQTGFAGKWHLTKIERLEGIPEIDADADVSDPSIQRLLKKRHDIQAEYVRKVSGFDFVQSLLWENFDNDGLKEKNLRYHNFEWILNGALDFIDQVDQNRPFLLYFASTAVHGPNHARSLDADPSISPAGHVDLRSDYYPARAVIKQQMTEMPKHLDSHIQAGMYSIDYQVAAIRKKLEEQHLDENTIVIYLSDHGVEPGKATSYLRGTRIPMIATWLGSNQRARISDGIVQICDLFPTLWDIASGGKQYDDSPIDGHSFASILRDENDEGRDFAYFENGYTRSVYKDGLHYMAWRYPQRLVDAAKNGKLEEIPDHLGTLDNGQASITMELLEHYWDADQLYDVTIDPWEMNNVYNEEAYSKQLEQLKDILTTVTADFDHPFDLKSGDFQESELFRSLQKPRLDRGTSYIYWYSKGDIPWPPKY